jgi:hypothetical protein
MGDELRPRSAQTLEVRLLTVENRPSILIVQSVKMFKEKRRQMAQSISIANDIIQASERCYGQLAGSEKGNRIAWAFLSALLVFVGSIVLILVLDATPFKPTDYFLQNGPALYFEVVGVLSIATGVLYYVLAMRRPSKYVSLSELISRARREGESNREVLLELVSQMIQVLPKMKQDKYDDSFFYGVLAFFLTAFLFPWNLVIAVAIWLYFRYEATSEYSREIMRFDNWKIKLQS